MTDEVKVVLGFYGVAGVVLVGGLLIIASRWIKESDHPIAGLVRLVSIALLVLAVVFVLVKFVKWAWYF
jgi:hypothetical protein